MRAILTYHSIDESESVISVSREDFACHVAWFASGRVRVTSVADLLRLPESTDAVAITFDDGFRNVGDIAAPMLAAHGLPSTVFVVTDHVGRTNEWEGPADPAVPALPLLDWDELARVAAQGMEVGAHTRRHRRLAGLPDSALADELSGASRVIEQRTGQAPLGFAYPYGSVDAAAVAMVQSTYAWGCTTDLRLLGDEEDRARLPRLDMYYLRERGRLESWGTAGFRYYLKFRSHARRMRQRWMAGSRAE